MLSQEIRAEEEQSLELLRESNTYLSSISGECLDKVDILRISGRSSSISATTLQFHLLFPEYPNTSIDSICHMVPIESWDTEESLLDRVKHVQYSTTRVTTRKVNAVEFLGGSSARLIHYRCTGVKICSLLDEDLKKYSHSSVSFSEWPLIRYPMDDHVSPNQTTSQVLSKSFYHFLRTRYQDPRYRCSSVCYYGKMKLVTISKGLYTTFGIGCTNFRGKNNSRHFWYLIKPTDQVGDLEYLKDLLNTNIDITPSITWGCHNVQQRTASVKICRLHCGNFPPLEKMECNVEFFHIIPDKRQEWPYTFTFSRGIHQHAPPPPTKTPQKIQNELQELIQHINPLQTGLRTFLGSDLLRLFLQKRQITTLSTLHLSLSNHSRLSYLLQRQKILDYPEGTDIAGVIFEAQRHHQDPKTAYIREVYHDKDQVLIITFSSIQAQIFSTCQTVQLDLTFKRVHGSINELVFVTWHHKAQKVCPLARIYMKGEHSSMYKLAFERTFKCLEKYLQRPIQWYHIHGSGIMAVTVDMDAAQAKGLGLYLTSLDPERSWQAHVQKVLIYCLVHYYRGIDTKFKRNKYYQAMRNLPASTKEQVEDLLKTLQQISSTKAWAQHKALPHVISGLNKYFSTMEPEGFNLALKHGNLVESSHWALNRQGVQESLLGAIIRARSYDIEVAQSCTITQNFNIWSTWNDRTPEKRLEKAALRQSKSFDSTHIFDINDFNNEDSPCPPRRLEVAPKKGLKRPRKNLSKDFQVSSSGIPQQLRPKVKRQQSTPNFPSIDTPTKVLSSIEVTSPADVQFLFSQPAIKEKKSTSLQSTLQLENQSKSQPTSQTVDLSSYEEEITTLQKAIVEEALKRAREELSR